MKVYLSYILGDQTPGYGGRPGFFCDPVQRIASGDSSNTAQWRLSNHIGTHIDFPRHFHDDGRIMDDYAPSFFQFGAVCVVHLPETVPGMVIGRDLLERADIPRDADMLLVRTGFYRLRTEPTYWQQGPVFLPETADYLRGHCPDVRVMGFDAISLSSWTARDTGREAHRRFLDPAGPILPLEDMDLARTPPGMHVASVIVAPLRVSGADAAPATVIAEVTP